MKKNISLRTEVLDYAEKKYGTKPEYLWKRFPDYAVLRHEDNQKWYGLIMNISYEKIDAKKSGSVDILNIKLDDILLADMLTRQNGYYTGYHISRGNWLSVALDGTVDIKSVCGLIDTSYNVTASKQKKQKLRPPKEWLIPANPKYYDILHAFDETDIIDWKQGAGIKKGDTVFMYVGSPVSAILYKCEVTETDIPYDYHTKELTITKLMKIKLQKRYKPDSFTFERLKSEYGIFAVRGPRSVTNSLSRALRGK
ncbi:MAG: MmcQ/YjbR family DNA-binding protein [Oscillospiraceae bacterium]|nr:MmcQ/YjbR family DNA-binding protein [Oscillospiraceae bacterium]